MFHTTKTLIVMSLAVACSGSAPGGAQESPRPRDISQTERAALAQIRLEKVSGVCQVVAATTTSSAKHDQTVVWLVDNQCKTEQSVDLINFREKVGGAPAYPFRPGPSGCTAQAGGSCAIVLVVLSTDPREGSSLNKVYTYDVGRKGGDPELVIEWP